MTPDVATYQRRGHWRRGRDGQLHWVSTHAVTRNGSSRRSRRAPRARKAARTSAPTYPPPVLWRRVPSEPNANCPVCGARVWFFRNKRGGCAYFDALGIPWPKHPCMAGFRFDDLAAQQAKTAYESAQRKAEARARRVALADERRAARLAERALRKAERDARVKGISGAVSKAPSMVAPELQRVSAPTQRTIGWWTVMAMLLAWVGSLPLSIADFNQSDDSPAWFDHWVVTMPTIVSLAAMLWFLWRVPTPRPSLLRLAGTVVVAPVFLVVGVLSFLFTLGIGSFVFAWILYRQAEVATSWGTTAA